MSASNRLWAAVCAVALGCVLSSGEASAAACPNAGWVVVEAKASPQTRAAKNPGGRTIFVRKDPITTTADLTEIKLTGDRYETDIQMTLIPEAAKRLHDATTDRSGMRIAFVADDRVLGAVTWTSPYGMDADLGVQSSLDGAAAPKVRPLVDAIAACVAEAK